MGRVIERDAVTIGDAVTAITYAADGEYRRVRTYSDGEVQVNERGRELYSYGRHFPLGHYAPRSHTWILNGDRWGGSRTRTPNHQTAIREAVARTSAAVVVIPFTALDGAGIALDSIRPIDVRPDENWKETRYADVLADVPRHERTRTLFREHEAETLAGLPDDAPRVAWRELTDAERETREADGETVSEYAQRLPVLPDADGRYRWKEPYSVPRERDADGRYSWTVNVHRLGDCLFSGTRQVTESRRPRPGETVTAVSPSGAFSRTCSANPYGADGDGGASHIADESGRACIFCNGAAAPIVETRDVRGRFLSSFDVNESPPLYFLAQVPRGAGETVADALESLAPRAVHAARARGREVYRQGDVFFVETDATRESLAERGATFARLTQWDRGAKARPGEIGYEPAPTAAQRRRSEARYWREARRVWRETYRSACAPLYVSGPRDADAHEARRAETRGKWHELLQRHEAERAACRAAGVPLDAPTSAPCQTCAAAVGAPCTPITAEHVGTESLAARIEHERERHGVHVNRETAATVHERARRDLRGETGRYRYSGRTGNGNGDGREPGRPATSHGARRDNARRRAAAAENVAKAAADLRRAVFADGCERGARVAYGSKCYGEAHSDYLRRVRVELIARVRERYADAVQRERELWQARGIARDVYRAPFNRAHSPTSAVALISWRSARTSAAVKVRPSENDGRVIAARRERVRSVLAVYGTSHSASEVARVRLDGGGFAYYVRGIARHVPDLESGRVGGRDHRPFTLGDGAGWYLALRNTVPRQRTRGRGRTAARR